MDVHRRSMHVVLLFCSLPHCWWPPSIWFRPEAHVTVTAAAVGAQQYDWNPPQQPKLPLARALPAGAKRGRGAGGQATEEGSFDDHGGGGDGTGAASHGDRGTFRLPVGA